MTSIMLAKAEMQENHRKTGKMAGILKLFSIFYKGGPNICIYKKTKSF